MPEKPIKHTEGSLTALLEKKYPSPEYAFLPQCRNGTGYVRNARTADALAMSLWPSRGLHLSGFEIKISKSDWMNEKKDPEKAEAIARYCDYWYVVAAGDFVVKAEDLPPTWGLIYPNEKGTAVRIIKEAQFLKAIPMDRIFLCGLLRKAAERIVPRVQITTEIELMIKGRVERATDNHKVETARAENKYKELQAKVNEFARATGIRMDDWRFNGDLSIPVKFALEGGIRKYQKQLEEMASIGRNIARDIEYRLLHPPVEPDYSI